MRLAGLRAGVEVERFVMQGRFARTPYYELRMEAEGVAPLDKLAQLLDEALAALNMEYASKRASGRLGPVRAVPMPAGSAERAEQERIRQRSGRSEQYKHRYLLTEVIHDEDI